MTKKEMFVAIKAMVSENAEMVEFLDHEIELLSHRKSDNSKAKKESEERATKVYNALCEMDKPVTIAELKTLTSDADVAGWTSQRISALLRNLGDSKVQKQINKGKAYFYAI